MASPILGSSNPKADDIAIVGLACRFPGGASDEAKLWELLSHRKSAFTDVPPDRFNVDAYYHPSAYKLNTLNSRGAHFMQQDVAAFDAPFFGITAQEAIAMDPAARMLLEVTYEAFENAGQRLEDVAGSDTSCYVGCFTRDYHEMLYRDIESAPMYTGTGTGFSLFSNRISWFYDLRGPSITLDTACSSSLVGLHLACRGLQAGESKMAVVCGANIILSPDIALTLANLHMLSMDGLSRSFADGTTGYGRGEGISTLVLKRYEDALLDGDPIRAVIRGTGVNQDGHTRGITVPNSEAQASLIDSVYTSAGLDPSATGYFEAHGTGTAVGDPLELGAIAKSISKARKSDNKLLVGSIKSNIGHLEGSAGLAGVIKCALMVEKNIILPNIHFDKPNPRIPFDQWKIQVPTTIMPWPDSQLRRASVNSFGYGGTNAHVIIDDLDSYTKSRSFRLPRQIQSQVNGPHTIKAQLLLLSARDEAALERLRQSYNEHLIALKDSAASGEPFDEGYYLHSLAYTLGCRRSVFPCRSFVVASSISELKESLGQKLSSVKPATVPRLSFVFTGQGAQWARMGMELMIYPVFAQSIQDADTFLSEELQCKWSVKSELEKGADQSRIEMAEFSQPLSTILQVALVDLLSSWGVYPTTVVGHSSGEIAAAYSYGAITRQDAWKVSYLRGQLCSQLSSKAPQLQGSMMAVGLSPEAVQPYIDTVENGKVVIACVNSPSSVTLSGDEIGIDEILTALKSDNIFARKLRVMNAYHSHHMQVLADDYLQALEGMVPQNQKRKETIKMASSVTGKCVTFQELGPSYWVQNLVSPVLFSTAVETLLKQPGKGRRQARAIEPAFDYLLEVGPHSALKGPLRQILQAHSASQISYSALLLRGENGSRTVLAAAGALFSHGTQMDVKAINGIQECPLPLTNLPPYPWNHSLKYWADSRISRARQNRRLGRHDLFGAPAQDSDEQEPRWRHFLRVSDNPWIRDHVVHSSILYPGSGILAMPLHALQTLADSDKQIGSIQLRDVHIVKAIIVPDDQFGLEVFLRMRRQRPHSGEWTGWWEFSVCSNQENDKVEEHGYGLGKINYLVGNEIGAMSQGRLLKNKFIQAIENAHAMKVAEVLPETFYSVAASVGLSYGPSFQGLKEINVGESRCAWRMQIPDTQKTMPSGIESSHIIHPTTLDIIFHSLFAAIGNGKLDMQNAAVPIGIENLTIAMDLPSGGNTYLKGLSEVSKDTDRDFVADIFAAGEQADTPSIVIQGLRCRELPNDKATATSSRAVKAPIGHVAYKVDIDLLDARELAEHIMNQESTEILGSDEELSENVVGIDSAIVKIVDLVAHNKPNASMMQVGSVTFELTSKLVSILEADKPRSKRLKSIRFFDSDQQILDDLAATYDKLKSRVEFIHIDSVHGTPAWGIKDSSIDLAIVSSQGLSEQEWNQRISEIAPFMKPYGKLLVIGSTEKAASMGAAGFSLDVLLQGSTDALLEQCALFIATQPLIKSQIDGTSGIVAILPSDKSESITAIASDLRAIANDKGVPFRSVAWPEPIPSLEEPTTIISLLEWDKSLITDLSEAEYETLKTIALAGKRLLWVAKGSDPIMQTATGFIRSLSNENVGVDYCFLHLEENLTRDTYSVAKLIARLVTANEIEKEYIERNGEICCSRWIENRELTNLVGASGNASYPTSITLREAHCNLVLTEHQSEHLFAPHDPESLTLSAKEVEIDVRSLLLTKGTGRTVQKDWREGAGIVTAISPTCNLSLGSYVSFAYLGPISTKIKIQEQYCQILSPDIEVQAAPLHSISIPAAHHLCTLAQLDSKKTLLIHGGGSVIGQTAAALAKEHGAVIYASVRGEEERLLFQEMGIPSDHLLDENEFYQSSTLMSLTNGHGFDAVFNISGGEEAISQIWPCVSPNGRFIDTSNNNASTSFNLSIKPFKLGASFDVVNMQEYLTNNFDLYNQIRAETIYFLDNSSMNFTPKLPIFTADKVHEALESINNPSGPGKAMLLFQPETAVPIVPEVKNQLRLRPDATYVLAGGLGGLGRSLAKLMVDSGAKYLVFLSRSGPGSKASQGIMEEFCPRGVVCQFSSCDVSDKESVSSAFTTISTNASWPPIRGIIQSAAVLRDSIFENMTHSQWMEAIRPKIQGTWNLHCASLSEPCAKGGLDFFVMLASISGFVGNRGQANYAAGNSYQDALARYRRSLGLAATSVNLGLMQDIGLIAERGGQSNLNDDTVVPLTAKDFNLIFKLAMNSEGHNVPAQIITGLPTGGILQDQDIETKPFYYRDRRFAYLETLGVDESRYSNANGADKRVPIEEQLAVATTREQATAVVLNALREQVAKALRCSADDVDTAKSMHTYGMDSLMAVDMRGWVLTKLKAEISLFDVMSGSSIGVLAEKISKASKLVSADLG